MLKLMGKKIITILQHNQKVADLEICNHMSIVIRKGVITHINPYKPSVLFLGHQQNSAKPDQMPQNEASDQVFYCLLTEVSFKI